MYVNTWHFHFEVNCFIRPTFFPGVIRLCFSEIFRHAYCFRFSKIRNHRDFRTIVIFLLAFGHTIFKRKQLIFPAKQKWLKMSGIAAKKIAEAEDLVKQAEKRYPQQKYPYKGVSK